jgi:membrane-bound lytic murein transglycosylase D
LILKTHRVAKQPGVYYTMRKIFIITTFFISGFIQSIASKPARQDTMPVFPDMLYEYRFAVLDRKTPLDLEYNQQVKKYIELYTLNRREDLARVLGLSKLYFPIFEAYLDKYNLPLELKYLAVVESGLDPLAKSSSGAIGLWQFLYPSAGMFNLSIDSYVDERRDVYKSTDAACRYFNYLYQTFGNWHLVLAAYNGGPGVVRNAIERSGGKTNLWDLLPYLPEQTQNYVPAFLAMNYIMTYAQEFKVNATPPPFLFSNIDTVYIEYPINFSQISENIGVSIDQLRFLNPRYKLDQIPETGTKQMLVLPDKMVKPYLAYENHILSTTVSKVTTQRKMQKVSYKVEKGDFLHKIALKYNCQPGDIREWNHLSNDFISPGQTLIIWISN